MDKVKRCSHCQVEKPLTEFNRKATSKDGYRRSCRACDQKWRKEWAGTAPNSNGPAEAAPPDAALAEDQAQGSEVPSPPLLGPEFTGKLKSTGEKVIGRIVPPEAQSQFHPPPPLKPQVQAPRVVSPAQPIGPTDEEAKAAEEYASILNKKLSVRQRAIIMVKIAKNFKGANAALALKAMQDINLATGIVSKAGAQIEVGPMFVLPADAKMATK